MGSEFHWIESIRLVRELMSEEGSEDGERQDVMNRTVELNLGIIVFIVRMIVLKNHLYPVECPTICPIGISWHRKNNRKKIFDKQIRAQDFYFNRTA